MQSESENLFNGHDGDTEIISYLDSISAPETTFQSVDQIESLLLATTSDPNVNLSNRMDQDNTQNLHFDITLFSRSPRGFLKTYQIKASEPLSDPTAFRAGISGEISKCLREELRTLHGLKFQIFYGLMDYSHGLM